MSDYINELTLYIQSIEPIYAYIILMVASIVENVFPPAPGDMITIFGASLVGTGHLNFYGVLFSTTVGSTIGFMAYFIVGKKFGTTIIAKYPKLFPTEAISKAENWISTYGFKLVLANRFLAGIRSVISLVCGISKLNTSKVLIYSTVSALVWNVLLVSAGAFIGENWEIIVEYVQAYAKWISILIVIIIMVQVVKKRFKK